MVESATFGIDRLDKMLGGGVPRGSIILVEESNEELSSFPSGYITCKFLQEGLKNGEIGVLILSEHLPDWYLSQTASIGVDLHSYKANNSLRIIDAFTSLSGFPISDKEEQKNIIVKSPSYALEFSSKLTELFSQLGDKLSRSRTIVDSLSISIYIMGFNEIWKLMLSLVARSNMVGHTALLILYPQMHDPREVAALERIADGIIEFRGERSKSSIDHMFRIKKMRGTDFSPEAVRYFKAGGSMTFE